jgi:hypothetical protein
VEPGRKREPLLTGRSMVNMSMTTIQVCAVVHLKMRNCSREVSRNDLDECIR